MTTQFTDVEGVAHEIECALYNGFESFEDARKIMKRFDDANPVRAMVEIDEAIDKLMQAHEFLKHACKLKKQINLMEVLP